MILPSIIEDTEKLKLFIKPLIDIIEAEDRKSGEAHLISEKKKSIKETYPEMTTSDINTLVKLLRQQSTAEEEEENLQSVFSAFHAIRAQLERGNPNEY